MDKTEPSSPVPVPSDEEPHGKSLLQKVKSAFGFRDTPDTTEELEQEIQELLEEGEEQGLISVHEERLINSIFDFRETIASEIMTPSAEMVCASVTASIEDLAHLIIEEGYTRIPIHEGGQDHIIGILHAKDLLRICTGSAKEQVNLRDLLNPAAFVPESKPITELLREFQARKTHMAFVSDEFGGVRGLVTLEDVIEEIVGEIDDEYDDEESELRVIDERTVIVDAKIDIEEVDRHFQLELPEGPYESVGGFIISRLGNVPAPGACVAEGRLVFKVLAADQRRIKTVKITRTDEAPAQE